MKLFIGGLIGLVLSVSVGAEPLLEGQVRLSSGQPAVGVQVRLFDLTDLRRFVGTTTDETGYFALTLQAFSTDKGTALPTSFALGQNYPNPFNPSTIIPYQIPVSTHVRLEVFNLLGQRLATLVDAERSAGAHTAQWDGTDVAGRAVGAGVYIYRLSGGGMTESRRMVLVDGQAGISAVGAAAPGPVWSAVEGSVEMDRPVYGLTVSGQGLVPHVDPAFRVGVDEAAIVVESYDGIPSMKLAISGVLGDVNGDGQVDLFDALYVMLYSEAPSIALPNHVDISLGDVNGDGAVDLVDALILIQYSEDPSNPALPPGIGEGDDYGDTLSEATQIALGSSIMGSLLAGDTDYFRVTVSSLGTLVAYTTGSTDTYGSIWDDSGSVLAENDESGEKSNFLVFTSVDAGTYYIEVRGYSSSTTGNYTLHVAGGPSDLVVESPSVSDSTLLFRHPFTLQVTVRNQGAGPADATTLVYYRSTDATISSSDTRIGSDDVSLLFASDTSAKSISLRAPEGAGTYYYRACVQSVTGESNTNNNCSDVVSVTVSQMSKIYWVTTNKVQRANVDGSYVETLVTVTGLTYLEGLALDVDGGKMYWTDGDKVQRANLDGSNIEDLVSGLGRPYGLALDVDGGKMYWTDELENKIQRANLDGSNVEDLVTELRNPHGLALDLSGAAGSGTGTGNMPVEESQLTPEIIALYGTLVTTFADIFLAALIPGTTSVPGERGSVEIVGNDWTFQDYSPDGALVINGTLNIGIDQTSIPLTGTVTFSGSQEAELELDIEFSIGADGTLYATGTITINGAEFDVAEISEAASEAAEAAARG